MPAREGKSSGKTRHIVSGGKVAAPERFVGSNPTRVTNLRGAHCGAEIPCKELALG